jgi:hypothetical protein
MELWFRFIDFINSYPLWAKLLAVGGAGTTILTLVFAPKVPPITDHSGITIDEPRSGERVAWSFSVKGRYKILPKESELWVVTNDSVGQRYWPQSRAIMDESKGVWTAKVSGIGGNPGDHRTFGVFLVGQDGRSLLEVWKRAAEQQPQLELRSLTRDFHKVSEVGVIVESGKP